MPDKQYYKISTHIKTQILAHSITSIGIKIYASYRAINLLLGRPKPKFYKMQKKSRTYVYF